QIAMFQSFARATDGDDIRPGQLGVLLLLAANPGINQTRLGRAIGIDRSTLVAVLDRLEARGLLTRTPSPGDRRARSLHLTAAGGSFLEDVMPKVRRHEEDLAAELSNEERRLLLSLLRRIG
ncbi:MAG: MarR family transcriptional regulator, partial [Alphaproteobacteria bacterium]